MGVTRIYLPSSQGRRLVRELPGWELLALEPGAVIEMPEVAGAAVLTAKRVDVTTGELGLDCEVFCSVAGCCSPIHKRGLCKTHALRAERGLPMHSPVRGRPHRKTRTSVAVDRPQPLRLRHPVPVPGDVPREDQGRRLDCVRYPRCLEKAAQRDWQGFTCRYCTGPGDEPHG